MDDDLERALSMSRVKDFEALEEERQIQEAIRISMLPMEEDASKEVPPTVSVIKTPNIPFAAPGFERPGLNKKRKASEELIGEAHKSQKRIATLEYPDGAIRLTRTPGRRNSPNCINLPDIIHKDELVSACIFAFYIENEEMFQHLPLSQSSDTVPIYIGRDVNMDPMLQIACKEAGIVINERGKLTKTQLAQHLPLLSKLHRQKYGKNYHSFYAWSPGSSHSKIMVLRYPTFLRIVITSCNMMDIDTLLGDNHWYIHDLPKLDTRKKVASSGFEDDLLTHLAHLSTPDEFIDSIRGWYDYSKVKVQLVTSIPGVCAGAKAEKHGLLRLRRILLDLNLDLPEKKANGKLRLEVCMASIGNLNAKWLSGFYDCALGKKEFVDPSSSEDYEVPDVKVFYPTVGDVKNADELSQEAASNIGCHTRPWPNAPNEIKKLFHHYESKDKGRLFHQKLILAYDGSDEASAEMPHYVYLGSANFSQSAWGALEKDKKKNKETCDMKLVKTSNFECGVVVPGQLIAGLLADGTKDWREGVVPYVQTGKQYDIKKEKPWNDPRWVTGYEGEGNGAWPF